MNRLTFRMFTGLLAGLALSTGCGSDNFVDAPCGPSGAACEGATGGGSSGHGGASSGGRAGQGGAGAGGEAGSGEAGGGSAGAGGVANVGARVRLAHFAPDGSDLHVCLKRPSDAADANLGERTSVSYKQVTTYTTVAAGDYLVRVVDAATTCAAGGGDLIADALPVTLADGDAATLLVREEFLADHTTQLTLSREVDETAPSASGGVSWRLLQTAFDAADVDFGYYGASDPAAGDTFFKTFADVTYADVKAAEGSGQTTAFDPAVDENGYAHLKAPFAAGAAFELRNAKTGDYGSTVVLPAAQAAARVVTLFGYSPSPKTDAVSLFACADDATGDATLAACDDLPADETKKAGNAVIRLASMSPDAMLSKVDVCVKPSSSAWSKDGTQTRFSGVTYPSVSVNTPLRADSYDVKLFPPGTGDCSSNGYFAKSGLVLSTKTQETLAASGLLAGGPTGFAFDLRTLTNDDAAASFGHSKGRVLNMVIGSAQLPDAEVDGNADGGGISGEWKDLPFGGTAPSVGGDGSTLGYAELSVDSDSTNAIIFLYPTDDNGQTFEVRAKFSPWSTGHVYSWWATGVESKTEMQLVTCDDTNLVNGSSQCEVYDLFSD